MDKRPTSTYEFGEFRLDVDKRLLLRQNGLPVALMPKAFETLRYLVEHAGKIVEKDELMSAVWTDTIVEENNLSQNISILRKVLGERRGDHRYIATVPGKGFQFVAEVRICVNGNTESEVPTVNEQARSLSVPRPKLTNRKFLIAAAVLATVFVAALSIVWFRFLSNAKNPAQKKDVVFMNLTDGESVDFATISPDGKYFCYVSHDREKAHLMLQQTGQSSHIEITEPIATDIYNTTFTRDSQFVYFVVPDGSGDSEHNSLYRVPTLGGVRTKVLVSIGSPVSFSPDGREMVFLRVKTQNHSVSMIIASSDGALERDLITMTGEKTISITNAAWSPDGKTIAYGLADLEKRTEGAVSIFGIEPLSGEIKPLSPEGWDASYRMAWTHDSQGLVFIGTKAKESSTTRRDQIYYLSIADGSSRRISTDGNRHQAYSLGVTDKDEILAVPFNRLSQIWSMDALGDALTVTQLTTGQADGRAGICPLADGSIAYLTRNGDGFSIWLMNGDGSNRRQLTTEPSAVEELRAASDGRFFVFSAHRDGQSHLFRLDPSGGNLMQLTSGEGHENDSTISPDGNWIVYNSFVVNGNIWGSALWKISSNGGEPLRLADIACLSPNYSPDGKFISCVSEDWKKISILLADDGMTIKSFDLKDHAILNAGAKWTPDGSSLAYIVENNKVGNIRLQPVGGGTSHQLTDFTSGDLYNFAYSANGSRLHLARGYSIRNAVMIKNFR